jgi:hypothetical protein
MQGDTACDVELLERTNRHLLAEPAAALVQIVEARELAMSRSSLRLRMALLLADNAVELLLRRVVEDRMELSRTVDQALRCTRMPRAKKDKALQSMAYYINERRRAKLHRSFAAMARFVAADMKLVPASAAEALCALHRYRNDAYHHGMVRTDSLETAVVVVIHIAALLLRAMAGLPRNPIDSKDPDVRWVCDRLGVSPEDEAEGVAVELVCDRLLAGLPSDTAPIAARLACHLQSRLDGVEKDLAYVFPHTTLAGALLCLQFKPCKPIRTRSRKRRLEEFVTAFLQEKDSFKPEYSHRRLRSLRERTARLASTPHAVSAFGIFSKLEGELEPLELLVADVVRSKEITESHMEDLAVEVDAARRASMRTTIPGTQQRNPGTPGDAAHNSKTTGDSVSFSAGR